MFVTQQLYYTLLQFRLVRNHAHVKVPPLFNIAVPHAAAQLPFRLVRNHVHTRLTVKMICEPLPHHDVGSDAQSLMLTLL